MTQDEIEENAGLEGDFDITDPLTLVHPARGRATVDADDVDRVFDVHPGARTTFRKLVIRDGDWTVTNDEGGGIHARSDVQVVASRIVSNKSANHGGGIGLRENAGLILRGSVVSGNRADNDGGGIDGDTGAMRITRSRITGNEANGLGGGMYFFSSEASTIERSTIGGNESGNGAGGLQINEASMGLRISASTISGNETEGGGGGIQVGQGELRLTNSTIAKNSAGETGGGLRVGGGSVVMNATTVAFNRADSDNANNEIGGGMIQAGGDLEIENSLVAMNRAGDGVRDDCAGVTSLGYNLLSHVTEECGGFNAEGDLVRGDPKIKGLASNRGPTKTVALRKGSPAVGKARRSTAPGRDQRGVKRDRRPDIGAFELK
jgi:hypothetical protein